jgi:hypothetical protein
MDKYIGPPRQALSKAVLQELESVLALLKDNQKANEDRFDMGFRYGYETGIRRAFGIVNYEIGKRQNPPDIFYGMESPPPTRNMES